MNQSIAIAESLCGAWNRGADRPPVATSNSPICGQVKLPQGERQEWMDCYSDWLAFARRLAASLSR